MMFDSATDSVMLAVTPAHDLNLLSELRTLTHKAEGFPDTAFPVQVMDDDFAISASVASVREDADSTMVIITATAGTAPTDETGFTVAVKSAASGGANETTDYRVASENDITIPMDSTSAIDTVYVTALDDAEMNEVGEAIVFTDGDYADVEDVYVVPASIMIIDADPDISLSLSHTSLDEGSGATVVTVTAELGAPSPGILTLTIGNIADCTAVESSGQDQTFRIDAGQSSGSGTVSVTPVADIDDNNVDCDVTATVVPEAKPGSDPVVNWTLQAAELTIVNADDSETN